MRTIERRLQKLEKQRRGKCPEYPPFTRPEIEAIAERIRIGESLRADERERLQQHSPIVQGNLVIHADRRRISVKRYVGIDLEQV